MSARTAPAQPDLTALRLPLALLLAGCVLFYLRFFNGFQVPYPDFFQYREHALSYLQFQLPDYFKRVPVYPALMALVSVFAPGPEPQLLAGELINLALAPVCLWLIFRIAARFVRPSTSLVITALCGMNPAMVYAVVQPNVEMAQLAAILWTVESALRRSPWAYAAAFTASWTRLDTGLIIPLVMLYDWLTAAGARRTKRLVWGAASSLGVVLWVALALWHPPGAGTRPPSFLEELLTREGELTAFAAGTGRVMSQFLPQRTMALSGLFPVAKAALLSLAAFGALIMVRRQPVASIIPVGFLAGYGAVHTLFPVYLDRYVVPILWVLYLAAGVAAEALISGLSRAAGARPAKPWRWIGIGVACAMIAVSVSSANRAMTSHSVRTRRAVFRQVGAWYRAAAKPDDKIITTLWRIVGYYSGRPAGQILYAGNLTGSSAPELLDELAALGVTYVVWDKEYAKPTSFDATRHKGYLLSVLKEEYPERLELMQAFRVGEEEAVVYRLHP